MRKYSFQKSTYSGVDTLSGKLEVFAIVADKRIRTPRGYKIGHIQHLKGQPWMHVFYKDPVVPTFWMRLKYIITGKPFGFYRKSPITLDSII